MRGEILRFDEADGTGLLTGDNGVHYTFRRTDLQTLAPVYPGARVDFIADGGVASGVFVLRSTPQNPAVDDPESVSAWRYFTRCLSRYADAHGRARRKEYWCFVLFQVLILLMPLGLGVGIAAVGGENPSDGASLTVGLLVIVAGLIYLALLLPGLCVLIRRFHDVGLSGWLILLGVIPYVGGLVTFIITLLPSQSHANKHGPVPGWSKRDTAKVFD